MTRAGATQAPRDVMNPDPSRPAKVQHQSATVPRLLGLQDAARELGISVWTLRDLIGAGQIRSIQPPGVRRIWLDRRDIDRAIEAWKT